jgi:hypothetical protein
MDVDNQQLTERGVSPVQHALLHLVGRFGNRSIIASSPGFSARWSRTWPVLVKLLMVCSFTSHASERRWI